MTTFLFWNINQKPLENIIKALVDEHQVDVLILAECNISPAVMLQALNPEPPVQFHFTDSLCNKIVIYTRCAQNAFKLVEETSRLTIRQLRITSKLDILLAATHLPSKQDWSDESQILLCAELIRLIEESEERVGHKRTVLVGDFNMNPFEAGVVAASGLHAVMTKDIAEKKNRTVQGKQYNYFYNPMWGHFGDATEGPAGTYYYRRAELRVLFWNMYDQVLIRPDLLSHFQSEKLKILSGYRSQSFLSTKGIPDRAVASDHLPLLFKLNL